MMKIAIENAKLGQVHDLLFNLSLKGKQSRHRTRFLKLIEDRIKEVTEQERQLLKEHCHLGEDGEPKKIDDGKRWDVKDLEEFAKDKRELYEEKLIIEGGDYHGMLKTLKSIVLDCEVEWQGQQAFTYDYLCEQFEGVTE